MPRPAPDIDSKRSAVPVWRFILIFSQTEGKESPDDHLIRDYAAWHRVLGGSLWVLVLLGVA